MDIAELERAGWLMGRCHKVEMLVRGKSGNSYF